jgi:hypothetical protein
MTSILAAMQGAPKGQQKIWEVDSVHAWLPAEAVITNANGEVTEVKGIPKTGAGRIGLLGPHNDGSWYVSYPREHPMKFTLPYYEFRWPFPDSQDFEFCKVDVSGISSNIVHFECYEPSVRLPLPADYFQLLGLPPDTVFVTTSPRG